MEFERFHFHLYFEASELEKAKGILNGFSEVFGSEQIGRAWDHPVGPHPIGSCQVSVDRSQFLDVMDWFLAHRDGLSVFVHPLTGDDLKDHTDYAMWIGESYQLKISIFGEAS